MNLLELCPITPAVPQPSNSMSSASSQNEGSAKN